ncbi:MAG: hypothetical protein WCR97_04745 [Bacilli bacterium]
MKIEQINKITEPEIVFKEEAHKKLTALMNNSFTKDKEFLFIGTVEYINNKYYITELFIPPQTSNYGAYCETDDSYGVWLIKNFTPEQRKKIRFQAHSHVNMNPNPSAIDDINFKEKWQQIDDFFISFIINKSNNYTLRLVDKKKGLEYSGLTYKYEETAYQIAINKELEEKLITKPVINTTLIENTKIPTYPSENYPTVYDEFESYGDKYYDYKEYNTNNIKKKKPYPKKHGYGTGTHK